jgi:hypothetical protein
MYERGEDAAAQHPLPSPLRLSPVGGVAGLGNGETSGTALTSVSAVAPGPQVTTPSGARSELGARVGKKKGRANRRSAEARER